MPIFEEIESGNTFTYLPSSTNGMLTDQGTHLPAYWGKTMAKNLNSLVADNRNFILISGNHSEDDGTVANYATDDFMVSNSTDPYAEMTIRGRGWMPYPFKNIRYAIVGAYYTSGYNPNAEFTIYVSDTPWPKDETEKKGTYVQQTFNIDTTNIADTDNSRVTGIIYDVPVAQDRMVYIYMTTYACKLGCYCFYADGVQ